MSKDIIVAKFGGTSMADAEAIAQAAKVAELKQASLVVVSATAGTTDALAELAAVAVSGRTADVDGLISEISARHRAIAADLGADLTGVFEELRTAAVAVRPATEAPKSLTDQILSFGERLSSGLMTAALVKRGVPAKLFDVREVIKTDDNFGRATPLVDEISAKARELLKPRLEAGEILVTQGFVASSPGGATTTLGRGGSDYSAALLAEALRAKELQIWTDVSGIASSDPRLVKNARKIDHLTFQEAAELATAGAKVLYSRTITPARRADIPVYVGNTFDPDAGGTTISRQTDHQPLVRAIALKTDQCLVSLTAPEMAYQFGYLAKIFDVFARFKVSIDQISTSEITVAVILDNQAAVNQELLSELKRLGEIKVEEGLSVISLIGNDVNDSPGLAKAVFANLEDEDDKISVRMICQGASRHNFCFVVKDQHSLSAVNRLHATFIKERSK